MDTLGTKIYIVCINVVLTSDSVRCPYFRLSLFRVVLKRGSIVWPTNTSFLCWIEVW